MRNKLFVAILLALPAAAMASEDCEVSFSGAKFNVCSKKSSLAAPVLSQLQSLDKVKNSTLRLIKFSGPITAAQRAAVEAGGARILDYAPYYAYIVRMDPSLDTAMRAIDGVIWSGPLLPALKVDANIYNELNGARIAETLGIQSMQIALADGNAESSLRQSLANVAGLSNVQTVRAGSEVRLKAQFESQQLGATVEELALSSDVTAISFDLPMQVSNSQGHWLHQSSMNTPSPRMPVWDRGIYGCGQIIGELDTGLFLDNVAFRDDSQLTPVSVCDGGASCTSIAPNFNARKVISYYKWSGLPGTSWTDEIGHGTHVAGSLIGNDNVSNPGTDCIGLTTPGGNTDLEGMAPGAKLVMQEAGSTLRYLNDTGGNPYHSTQIAYENGARIHNNSWGAACFNRFVAACARDCVVTYGSSSRDADRAAKDFPDALILFAAGNDASICPTGSNLASPGNAKNVLTMGATLRGAAASGMADFSSRGPTSDSRTKPDLTAQGDSIMSAALNANGTRVDSGTSMATPTAAGLAALVRDYLAQGFYPSGVRNPADAMPDPSGLLIKAIMMTGAVTMAGGGAGPNPGPAQGFGRIHLDNSLYFLNDQNRLYLHESPAGLVTGSVDHHQIELTGGQPLSVVLTWLDDPAAIGASPATVNSLRLEVEAPNGEVWTQKLPAGFNVNNSAPFQDATTSNYDNLNTVHRISFAAPATGIYKIRVRGIHVPGTPQNYVLALTGGFEVNSEPDYALTVNPVQSAICAGETATLTTSLVSLNGLTDPVALSVSGIPAPATASFSVSPVIPAQPAATSTLTIASTAGLASGDYTFEVGGASTGSPSIVKNAGARLKVDASAPAQGTLIAPADASSGVQTVPLFSWSTVPTAAKYRLEVSADPTFATRVIDEEVSGTNYAPAISLFPASTYYWRVSAVNACQAGPASAVRSFTTANEICKNFNLPIPDGNTAGVSDSFTITDPSLLSDLKISIKARHSWVGDLQFRLSRGATSIMLVDRPGHPEDQFGCGDPDVDIVLDDSATQPVDTQCNFSPPALSGPVRPDQSINAAFAGTPFAGTWTLTAIDPDAPDNGRLTRWCLIPSTGTATDALFRNGFDSVP